MKLVSEMFKDTFAKKVTKYAIYKIALKKENDNSSKKINSSNFQRILALTAEVKGVSFMYASSTGMLQFHKFLKKSIQS